MHRGTAFDDVLDAHLSNTEADRRAPAVASHCGTAAAYGFLFVDARPHAAEMTRPRPETPATSSARTMADGAGGTAVPGLSSSRIAATAERQTASAVCRRVLSSRQRQALCDLLALGVSVSEDFSPRELRSAFRTLARRFHPDRHAGSSERERTELARTFARVCDSYQVLAAA